MPYIHPAKRSLYDGYETQIVPEGGGDLNYVIARLLCRYTEFYGLSYNTITEVRGACLGAWHEYERCVADKYEEQKREGSGDVWGSLTAL